MLFHLSSHSHWRDVLTVVDYSSVYYAVLYYLYRKDRMFEFYLIGFMLALATLPYLLGSMKDAPRGISIRQEYRHRVNAGLQAACTPVLCYNPPHF